MRRTRAVKFVTVCPACGEAVELIFTKKMMKKIWLGFKKPLAIGNLEAEKVRWFKPKKNTSN